ncbi:ABC transporter permease [Aquiflexum sp.]|uniref:ABC transporter permease n=1 Tax=Aquiflexum sp. TaxID=1872584 RepID=UPI0035940C4F
MGLSYIRFENSYEGFHNNSEQIYRLVRTYRSQDYCVIGFPAWSSSSSEEQQRQVESLKSSPGVTDITQFITSPYSEFIRADEKQIPSNGILSTNTPSGFVNMFTWDPLLGYLESFGSGNNKVLLTASLAERLFGRGFQSQDALVGIVSHKAALENPAQSLKTE